MLRRPPPLHLGDPVAVVAPASPPRDLEVYTDGLNRLREDYDVRHAWQPGRERGYLAAPDGDRTEALHRAIEHPEIRAIFCVRGGYGCLRLLDRLDWDLARDHPTLLVGYSDVTALHMALNARAQWPGVSGPVVTEWAQASEATLDSFRRLSSGGTGPICSDKDADLTPISTGTASGPVLGGNLSVFSRLIGTPYIPDMNGALLVLEDVSEPPYRVDRMLAHLQHAGILSTVAGVLLGAFSTGNQDSEDPTLSLEAVFEDYFGDRPYPVVRGLPYGHMLPRCSLPLGGRLHLTASSTETRVELTSPIVEPTP